VASIRGRGEAGEVVGGEGVIALPPIKNTVARVSFYFNTRIYPIKIATPQKNKF